MRWLRPTVFVVAANNDRTNSGDRTTAGIFTFTWGCEPITLHRDIDGDGFGGDAETRPDCNEREGWSSTAGDCNDLWGIIHPDAAEIGNSKDDNCDGQVDEGIDTSLVYPDQDGDGYGDRFAEAVASQPELTGYVPNAEDCDDGDAAVYPSAEELCDGLDNNCDTQRDEGTFQYCGVGICSRRIASCTQECIPGTPAPELCNGLDDDCNGTVDDGSLCPAGQLCLPLGCVVVDENLAPESTPTDSGTTLPMEPTTERSPSSSVDEGGGNGREHSPTSATPNADGALEGTEFTDAGTVSNGSATLPADPSSEPALPGASPPMDASAKAGCSLDVRSGGARVRYAALICGFFGIALGFRARRRRERTPAN